MNETFLVSQLESIPQKGIVGGAEQNWKFRLMIV